MRREAALADRGAEVLAAGRAWRRAGAIDDAALAELERAHPGGGRGPGMAARIVYFLLSLLGMGSAVGLVVVSSSESVFRHGSEMAFLAACCLALAEYAWQAKGRRASPLVAAACLYCMGLALWAIAISLAETSDRTLLSLLLAAAVILLAWFAYRYGFEAFAVASAATFFVWLARLPAPRLVWLAAAAILAVVCPRGFDARRLPPSHRRSLLCVALVAAAAAYAAVNRWSLDARLIEQIGGASTARAAVPPLLSALSWAATFLLPAVLLLWGLASRRTPILDLGVALLAASLVTLRRYVHLAPLWVILAGSGAALIALAVSLDRWLDSGEGKERWGFTAEPLFEDALRRQAIAVVAAAAAFSPEAQARRAPGPSPVGKGGSFGGGGATEGF